MTAPSPAWPARYLRDPALRRRAEWGFWATVLLVQAAFNSVVTWLDLAAAGRRLMPWEPALWELSSVVVIAALIPAVAAFERRFPLHWDTLARHLPWHALGSVAYCTLHLIGMVALRYVAYAAMGVPYRPGDWWAVWGYEYLKDVRTYGLILSALVGYRFLLLRLQGEARVLDAPEPAAAPPSTPTPANDTEPPGDAATTPTPYHAPPSDARSSAEAAPPPPTRPERFLVRKLRREFLIAAGDIAWLQAEANYVGLHVNGHDYLLRSTLTDFLTQLDPARGVRVHRSYAVNLDAIAEIEPLDSGDARLVMKDGSSVPCSRRYREGLVPQAGRGSNPGSTP